MDAEKFTVRFAQENVIEARINDDPITGQVISGPLLTARVEQTETRAELKSKNEIEGVVNEHD